MTPKQALTSPTVEAVVFPPRQTLQALLETSSGEGCSELGRFGVWTGDYQKNIDNIFWGLLAHVDVKDGMLERIDMCLGHR